MHELTPISRSLLRWYRKNARALPWRETNDPYRIWISEIMLQQTQVSRVIDYYQKFLTRFPTIEDLAKAQWRELLPLWRGLGYYSRARNLSKTAKILRREFQGTFPRDDRALASLPGIGKYTSAAIRSFAFDQPVPAIDTNLTRVFERLFLSPASKNAQDFFDSSPKNSGLLNHALMDLGALVCTARNPKCEICPLSAHCRSAFRISENSSKHSVRSSAIPSNTLKAATSPPALTFVAVGCVHLDGAYLFERTRNSFEFPAISIDKKADYRKFLRAIVKDKFGIEISIRPPFHSARSTGSHEGAGSQIELLFCRAQVLRGSKSVRAHWRQLEDLDDSELSEKTRIAIDALKPRFPKKTRNYSSYPLHSSVSKSKKRRKE